MKAVASDNSLRLVGSVSSEDAVTEILETQQPGLLIIGTNLIKGPSTNVIRQAVSLKPSCGVIVSTMFSDSQAVIAGIKAGATGYLLMDSSIERIVNGIKEQTLGQAHLTPWIARQILLKLHPMFGAAAFLALPSDNSHQTHKCEDNFCFEEISILHLIASGTATSQVSNILKVSNEGISRAIAKIYRKVSRMQIA